MASRKTQVAIREEKARLKQDYIDLSIEAPHLLPAILSIEDLAKLELLLSEDD